MIHGETIAFQSDRGGKDEVWLVPSAGGQPTKLEGGAPSHQVPYPRWSPDGASLLLSAGESIGLQHIVVVPAMGGDAIRITHDDWHAASGMGWSADGESVFLIGRKPGDSKTAIWAVSIDDGTARVVLDPEGSPYLPFDGAAHGDRLYVVLRELRGDLWVAELESR